MIACMRCVARQWVFVFVLSKCVAVTSPIPNGSQLFLNGVEATQGLYGRSRVRDGSVSANPGGFHAIPNVRSTAVGDEGGCHRYDFRLPGRCFLGGDVRPD